MATLGTKLPFPLMGILLAMPMACAAQQNVYNYSGTNVITVPPMVNATNFINSGTWDISSASINIPYQTFNTLYYANSGTMNCSIGWEFDRGPYPIGTRTWSGTFSNNNIGTISATDLPKVTIVDGLYVVSGVSELLVSATNIVNKGLLTAGSYGKMILNGSGVNLSRSGLEISAVAQNGSNNGLTNFIPSNAIYDEYWVGGTNGQTFVGPTVWNGVLVGGATFNNAGELCGVSNGVVSAASLVPQAADSYYNYLHPSILITTNSQGGTNPPITIYSNIVKQAVFAYVSDPSITPSVRFGPPVSPTNYFLPMAAKFITYATNMVTDVLEPSTIYVVDNLAAIGTNGTLLLNLYYNPGGSCTAPTYRPDSVVVERDDPSYAQWFTGYGTPPSDFFYFSGIESNIYFLPPPTNSYYYSNSVCFGRADAYSALVDNLAAEPPAGFSITNAPGRIEVYAKDVDLTKVRMSAAGIILVQASNLVGSVGATMDCQNLSYILGSTNGLLNITNLAGQNVHRLNGTVNEWSGLWTNYLIQIYQNYVTNSAATNAPFYIESDITNVTEVDMAITVVDGGGLSTIVPVNVLNLTLHSTNMIVSDTMNVGDTLLFDGTSLTIQGGLILKKNLSKWTSLNAPTLRYFTNNGNLEIPGEAHFGDDGRTNYAIFANNGTITASSETINSDTFQSGGSQNAAGGYYVTTTTGKVENGIITSGQGAQFAATTLKLNQATITAGDQLYFYVTGSLFDAGWSSGNILTCNNGFDLAKLPTNPGDLLGTSLETITPVFVNVDHYWPGVDEGNNSVGYASNEAVGKLILNEGSDSEFSFHATGARNAIYVDLLDLSQCPDFLDPTVLTIDPNFVIYFAAAKLPPSFIIPPNTNGIPQQPEEFLNGQLGGHLVWVSSFAGPNSSVYVVETNNNQTASVLVNKALRYSKIIDSNGNGTPNYYDPYPFPLTSSFSVSGSMVQSNIPPIKKFAISWTAAPNTVYQVQSSTSFIGASWTPLLNYTNTASTNVVVTVWDTNALAGQRFYRVSHP